MALACLSMGIAVTTVAQETSSFIDPTVASTNRQNITVGERVYIAPFASLKAGADAAHGIQIGNDTNVQDNVLLDAHLGAIQLGQQAILAHGSALKGPASVSVSGACPNAAQSCPSFVGFNAEVDGGTVNKDAMVIHLARVGSGVTIVSGCKVLPGKNITSQSQVGTPPACNPPFTAPVTEADREFMEGVIRVNQEFAKGYTELAEEDPSNVYGINFDPDTEFNPGRNLPTLHGQVTRLPSFGNRIIGDVRMEDEPKTLFEKMGFADALRADEGAPFEIGTVEAMAERVTFHALEHTHMVLGAQGRYRDHVVVHGGPANFDPIRTGSQVTFKSHAVFFRSSIGDQSVVGCRSLVQQSNFPADTVIPDKRVVIENQVVGNVEWGECPPAGQGNGDN